MRLTQEQVAEFATQASLRLAARADQDVADIMASAPPDIKDTLVEMPMLRVLIEKALRTGWQRGSISGLEEAVSSLRRVVEQYGDEIEVE